MPKISAHIKRALVAIRYVPWTWIFSETLALIRTSIIKLLLTSKSWSRHLLIFIEYLLFHNTRSTGTISWVAGAERRRGPGLESEHLALRPVYIYYYLCHLGPVIQPLCSQSSSIKWRWWLHTSYLTELFEHWALNKLWKTAQFRQVLFLSRESQQGRRWSLAGAGDVDRITSQVNLTSSPAASTQSIGQSWCPCSFPHCVQQRGYTMILSFTDSDKSWIVDINKVPKRVFYIMGWPWHREEPYGSWVGERGGRRPGNRAEVTQFCDLSQGGWGLEAK